MELFNVIEKLTQSPGPTGFETRASEAAAELLRPLVDEVRIDKMGSVIGIKRCGKENAKKIVLDAHMDEVGMMVMGYDHGYLRFTQLGGIDPRVLVNREVEVLTDPVREGIICGELPEDGSKALPLTELRIDIGLTQEEAQALIPIGTPVVYKQGEFRLGESLIAGKSLDDRSCFAVILRAMELLNKVELDTDVYVLGSVGEETDSRGAIAAVYDIAPDYAVAVDVTFGKSPDCSGEDCFALGSGAVIGVGPNVADWMFRRMKEKAEQEKIPYGVEVMAGSTGTNGWDIQILREGIPTALLSLPLRYMHTPVEVIHQEDVEQCARLLAAFTRDIGKEGL